MILQMIQYKEIKQVYNAEDRNMRPIGKKNKK